MRGDIRPPSSTKRLQRSRSRTAPRRDLSRRQQFRMAAPNLIRKRELKLTLPGIIGAAALLLALGVVGTNAKDNVMEARGDVSASVEVAQSSFQSAQKKLQSMDIAGAEQDFATAQNSLEHANQALASQGLVGGLAAGQASGDIRTAQQLLQSAQEMAGTGRELAADVRKAGEETAKSDQGFFRAGEIMGAYLPRIDDRLDDLDRQLKTMKYLQERSADSSNPELKAAAGQFDEVLPTAQKAVEQAKEVTAALPDFLGHDQFKRYLLLFQNPAELRPTGGFTGTLGQLTLDDGAVKEFEIETVYNPANQAKVTFNKEAPGPLSRPTNGDPNTPVQWLMQDANWNPDFPTSAQAYQNFYEKAGRSSVDGVIAVTASPIVEILRVVGPIEQPDAPTLDADSFYETVAGYQQTNATAGNDPKALLRDFMPKLLEKIRQAPPEQQREIRRILSESLKAKDVQLYFSDDRLEDFVTRAGLSGKLAIGPGQLAMVEANLAANKSSTNVTSAVERKIEIQSDGTVKGDLKVKRTYQDVDSDDVNGTYTRFYFPKGTEVDATDGWAEYEAPSVKTEGEYTVLGGWTDVEPGESRTANATFELPEKLDLRTGKFPLTFWRQAGSQVTLVTEVTLPDGYVWDGVPGAVVTGNTIRFEEPVRSDIVHQLTFKKQ